MFDAFFDAVARILAFFYSLPVVGGSVGVAIILLTAAVMMLLMPLTIKSTKSTIKMQEVQPKLKELQRKHKDDKQTLNAELMALYQANGINPVGGCLPMLAQLPVFLVLFNVLQGLSRRVSQTPYFAIADHARSMLGGQSLAGDQFDPKYLSTDSELYVALSRQTEMKFGPFDLAQRTLDVVQSNVLTSIPYVLLILFVVATSYYQQRQVSSRRTGSMGGMNPQQEMILKAMPLLSGVWSFVFPAGLVLYWATSNVFRIGQQYYITRAFYGDSGSSDESGTVPGEVVTDADREPDDREPDDREPGGKAGGSSGDATARPTRRHPAPRPSDLTPASSNGDTAGAEGIGEGGPVDREEAWARRRREKARAQARAKGRGDSPSGRVTPKGTKPGANRSGTNRPGNKSGGSRSGSNRPGSNRSGGSRSGGSRKKRKR